MNRVNYTIVFVSDMQRSIGFYRDALGLPLKFESPKWTEFATEGTTLALHLVEERGHNAAGTCQPGFEVEDMEAFHRAIEARGGRCLQAPKLQDFGGKLAIYADPDGLPLSAFQWLQREPHVA